MRVTTYLLLPSVLLGAVVWEPVAERLYAAGDTVVVASTAGCTTPGSVLAAYVAAAPPGAEDLVVVPHSNAGFYAAAVADQVAAAAVVYVDAALPERAGPTPLAPPGLLDLLSGIADRGEMLPPWTSWWPDMDALFPDERTRARAEASQPRLPLDYFRSSVHAPAGWESASAAYLAFGDTYAQEQLRAAELGWPRRRLDGEHLHLLHDPAACAAAVVELREHLG